MPNIVVIGASAGGLEPLKVIVAGLPPHLEIAVFIVMHLSATGPSVVPQILNSAGHLAVINPLDGEEIRPRTIYVAPPDKHMTIQDGRTRVVHGPKENRHRPAIDPLFRTAARTYGPRVAGVILSGMLDDGVAGLQIIKAHGGVAIVQNPGDAEFSSMPQAALAKLEVDFIVTAAEMPRLIEKLAVERWSAARNVEPMKSPLAVASDFSMENAHLKGTPSAYTCPECNGTLWELREGEIMQFRCRVGHAYSEDSIREGYSESVEAALWSALRSLEESASLERRLAQAARDQGNVDVAVRFEGVASSREEHARTIRKMLLQTERLGPA